MALYHKHRPQLWQSVIGQDVVVETIQNQIKTDKPAHAYLLSGPRGVGKTTTARLIAKALNCEKRQAGEAEPCNECPACLDITNGSALDVIEIDAASHTGVDTVRETIIENAQFQPTHSKYKIFIIDEVHMLSTSAFNALLKTLEEPPAYAIFILATTELAKLPATIISRCQRYSFKKIPREKMVKKLAEIAKEEKIKIDDEVLNRIVKKSEGSARDAVSLFDQLMATTGTTITLEDANLLLPATNLETQLEFIRAIADKNISGGLTIINQTVEAGLSLTQFMADLIDLSRYLLISLSDSKLALDELEVSGTMAEEFTALSKRFSSLELVRLIDRALKRNQDLKTATIPQLPLELFLVESTLISSESTEVKTVSPQPIKANPEPVKKIAAVENTPAPVAEIKIEPIVISPPSEQTEPVEIKPTIAPIVVEQTPSEVVPSNSNDVIANLDRKTVERKWPEFVHSLELNNPSLVFLLKMAELKEVVGDTITISVRYSFHHEKLTEKNAKRNLDELLCKFLGQKTQLVINLEETSGEKPAAELNDLATAFGGQVV